MQTGDYWRQFESTGSIQDYLRHKGAFDSRCTAALQNGKENSQNTFLVEKSCNLIRM